MEIDSDVTLSAFLMCCLNLEPKRFVLFGAIRRILLLEGVILNEILHKYCYCSCLLSNTLNIKKCLGLFPNRRGPANPSFPTTLCRLSKIMYLFHMTRTKASFILSQKTTSEAFLFPR